LEYWYSIKFRRYIENEDIHSLQVSYKVKRAKLIKSSHYNTSSCLYVAVFIRLNPDCLLVEQHPLKPLSMHISLLVKFVSKNRIGLATGDAIRVAIRLLQVCATFDLVSIRARSWRTISKAMIVRVSVSCQKKRSLIRIILWHVVSIPTMPWAAPKATDIIPAGAKFNSNLCIDKR
jgi:hypothetical protein